MNRTGRRTHNSAWLEYRSDKAEATGSSPVASIMNCFIRHAVPKGKHTDTNNTFEDCYLKTALDLNDNPEWVETNHECPHCGEKLRFQKNNFTEIQSDVQVYGQCPRCKAYTTHINKIENCDLKNE